MEKTTSRGFWRGPGPWLIAAIALAAVTFSQWRDDLERPVDPRPAGSADDVAALATRDDINVVFVLIDTLRAERLRTYGYGRPTSPFLDLLAAQGLRFGNHLSQSSWTKCSMASLWTGLYPQRSGVTRFDDIIAPDATTAVEIFKEAGFRTAGIWRNGWVEGYFGFDQGFDIYTRPSHNPVPPEVRRENPTLSTGGTDFDIVSTAEEFLRVYGDERFFLYLHLMDLHEYTYGVESALFGSSYSDIYDNAIHHTNLVLDSLLGVLYASGHLDDTLFIIGSDHGEAFGERGSEGHARDVYPETTEVPLVIGFPFRLPQPVVVEERTANVDLWPTVLDMLGLPAIPETDGVSRMPEILAAARGEAEPSKDGVAIAHLDQVWGQRVEKSAPNVQVTEDGYRYMLFHTLEGEQREELFESGRGEASFENQIDTQPEVASRLRSRATTYLEGVPPWGESSEHLELDELQLNQLRALGYAIP